MVRRVAYVVSAVAGLVCLSAVVHASPEQADQAALTHASEEPYAPSRSLGWPWDGRLAGGLELESSARVELAESEEADGHFWGTAELVRMVRHAVAHVDERAPGASLTVGELSRRHGGDLPGHRSHESGRDIDLGFYLTHEDEPVEASDFVPVTHRGVGRLDDDRLVHFDDERNWLLIKGLLTAPQGTVKHVFTASRVRERLLEEARRRGDDELADRAKWVIMSPEVSHPHTDHFHVRIFCPPDDLPYCRDKGPFWPWLPDAHPFADRPPPKLLR